MSTRHFHQIRRGATPTIAQDKASLQLELYDSLADLFLDPSPKSFNRVARMLTIARQAMALQRVSDFDRQFQSAQRTLDTIYERWQQSGQVVAYQFEKLSLRAVSVQIHEAINTASVRSLAAARDIAVAAMTAHGAKPAPHPLEKRA